MNREIKFRAWDRYRNEMHYNMGVLNPPGGVMMQYTGLPDNNDVEIYEGDIIRVVNKGRVREFEIVWMNTKSRFMVLEHITNIFLDFTSKMLIEFQVEVIGNIYEDKGK